MMEIWKRRLMQQPPEAFNNLRLVILLLIQFSLQIASPISGQSSRRPSNFLLHLNGSEGSFVQLSDWRPTPLTQQHHHQSTANNWTLSLDFRTNITSGVLLYVDDNSKRSFIQLRLVSSQLEMRLQTPQPLFITTTNQSINAQDAQSNSVHSIARLGRDLRDNQWHTVLIDKVVNVLTIRVQSIGRGEEVRERISLPSSGRFFDGPVKVFIGGLPDDFSGHFAELASPSVVFEKRFSGVVGSVSYNTEMHENRPQIVAQSGAVKEKLPFLCDAGEFRIFFFYQWRKDETLNMHEFKLKLITIR